MRQQYRIPFARPYMTRGIDAALENEFADIFTSGRWTAGPKIQEFEEKFAEYLDCKHVIAVSSCTAALYTMLSVTAGAGYTVKSQSLTHCAVAHAAHHTQTDMEFVDCDERGISVEDADLTFGMDYCGYRFDREVLFIDAAHSLYGPRAALASCYSFHPSKILTCGEGGAIATNDDDFAEFARSFRSFGYSTQQRDNQKPYDVTMPAFNFRMTEFQAAILLAQLGDIDHIAGMRNGVWLLWDDVIVNPQVGPCYHNRWTRQDIPYCYNVTMPSHEARQTLRRGLAAIGIETVVHYETPLHRTTAFKQNVELPNTDMLSRQSLSLPVGPHITAQDFQELRDPILGAFERALSC